MSVIANTRTSVLDRAAALLAAFAPIDGWVGPSELGRRTGLPKPTAHRLALQLARHGLLEHHDGAFRLGPRLFELGHLVAHERRLRERAAPLLARLHKDTGQAVQLAELAGHDVLYLEIVRDTASPTMPSRVGGRLPAHATALGKALLAHSAPEIIGEVLRSGLRRLTPATIIEPARLHAELRTVAAAGVALDLEECRAGVSCVAAPVFAPAGHVVAALSATGVTVRFPRSRAERAVRAAAADLTRELGRLGGAGHPG
jgi:DNA-binding IclR family transcriptional regulator